MELLERLAGDRLQSRTTIKYIDLYKEYEQNAPQR